jgi:hypothetical protein
MLKKPPAKLSGKDFDKITRCLNLTNSDHDGEALAAIRGANRILTSCGLSWENIWEEMEREVEERQPTIGEALRLLLDVLEPGSFRKMITSIADYWVQRHALSEKQRKVVMDAYERHQPYIKRNRREDENSAA